MLNVGHVVNYPFGTMTLRVVEQIVAETPSLEHTLIVPNTFVLDSGHRNLYAGLTKCNEVLNTLSGIGEFDVLIYHGTPEHKMYLDKVHPETVTFYLQYTMDVGRTAQYCHHHALVGEGLEEKAKESLMFYRNTKVLPVCRDLDFNVLEDWKDYFIKCLNELSKET